MPQIHEPDGLDKPRPELSERLTTIMRRELPSLSEEIVSEIRDTISEYARPLDGPYGRTLRSGVERALNGFFAWVVSPNAPLDDICRKLGEFEAYEGRQLDTLQSAYRVGAQTSWRRIMALHRRHDLQPTTVSVLADALFAYMEELASLSLAGYLEAKARSNPELAAGRRRLLRLILAGPAGAHDLIAEQAERVGWAVPERVTLVALQSRGTAAQVGEDLGVHPQTVRYRMRQIEQILGDDLADPDARFALEVVLRALRLRQRATSADTSPARGPEHEIH